MNWNGQGKDLDFLIAKRYDRMRAPQLQADFNSQRLARVQKALQTRPVYIPLQFVMAAAGQVSPYRQVTKALSYGVIITGVRTDSVVDDTTDGVGGAVAGGNRNIVIERSDDTRPLASVQYDADLYLTLDEIAGKTAAAGGGQSGVFYLPKPIVLDAGERLTVQMMKQDTTADLEIANVVFVGVAVYDKGYISTMLDDRESAKINELLQIREHPQIKFLKQTFNFDTAAFLGAARDLSTPQVDEPLLVRGMRTSLANSMITVNVQGHPQWTVDPTPIWALAAEKDLGSDNYIWFSRPIFLHSQGVIQIPVITNGTGTAALPGALDPQNSNTITWLCETV